MARKAPLKYPEAYRDESINDNYFGTKVLDPYRWLEDPDSSKTKTFITQQNVITKKFLNDCPYRDNIKNSLAKMWDYPKYSCPFREGEFYFFHMNTGLQNQSVLYIMKELNSDFSVFLNPNTLSEDGTVALSASKFSKDGSTLAYGLSSGGSDWMTIHFKDVETKKDYPEILSRVKFSSITWTIDNKGIFYGMYPAQSLTVNENLTTESDEHQKLYYHRLNTPQSEDVLVLEFPDEPRFRITTDISHCGRYLVVYLQKGCRDNLVYFCDLEKLDYNITGKLPITQVVHNLEADYEYITNTGPIFVFRTNKNASNYRLIQINFEEPEEENWTTLIEEQPNDVLEWAVAVNNDKLIICYMWHVTDYLVYCDLSDGKQIHTFQIEMGSIAGFSGKKELSEIFFKVTGFTIPGTIYRVDLNDPKYQVEVCKEVEPEGFEKDLYQTSRVSYEGKDGTTIPMFLVHTKDLKKNGRNPCLLYGYGGFNISIKPYFSVFMTVFIKHLKGVLAIPNIRGGGEYGDAWHNQGRFENKQNTFNDFVSAAEYLIDSKYTSPYNLIIKGDSNGGLVVAASALQRPDLFGAVLCGAGVLDMLRFHKFTIGSAWVSEYGCSDSEQQFQYLYKYSPLHNVKVPAADIQYPAFLLTTADHDDRVVPFHSLKFIATLQHVIGKHPKQKNPLLIRVDVRAGHGAGKPTSKMIDEATDLLCFVIESLQLKFYP